MLFLEYKKKSSRNYVSLFNRARNSPFAVYLIIYQIFWFWFFWK